MQNTLNGNLCGAGKIGGSGLHPQLKAHRLVSQDHQPKVPVSRVVMTGASAQVPLRGYGRIPLFQVVTPDGDTEPWATHALTMTRLTRLARAERAWTIETAHRGIK